MATLAFFVCILAINANAHTQQHLGREQSTLPHKYASVTIGPAVSAESIATQPPRQGMTYTRSPHRGDLHQHPPIVPKTDTPTIAAPPPYSSESGHGRLHHHNYHARPKNSDAQHARQQDPQQQEQINQKH